MILIASFIGLYPQPASKPVPEPGSAHAAAINPASNALRSFNVSAFEPDDNGWTPLHYAAASGMLGHVQYMIRRWHVNINEATCSTSSYLPLHTPLMIAQFFNHTVLAQYLIQEHRIQTSTQAIAPVSNHQQGWFSSPDTSEDTIS